MTPYPCVTLPPALLIKPGLTWYRVSVLLVTGYYWASILHDSQPAKQVQWYTNRMALSELRTVTTWWGVPLTIFVRFAVRNRHCRLLSMFHSIQCFQNHNSCGGFRGPYAKTYSYVISPLEYSRNTRYPPDEDISIPVIPLSLRSYSILSFRQKA